MKRARFCLALAVCVGALLLLGCGDKTKTKCASGGCYKPECESSDDCPSDFACIANHCYENQRPTFCVTHADCQACNICDTSIDPNVCTYDSNACIECAGAADCPEDYDCYVPTTGMWHCVPATPAGDSHVTCDPADATTCRLNPACPNDMTQTCDPTSLLCVCTYKSCKAASDCPEAERCDLNKGICVPKV